MMLFELGRTQLRGLPEVVDLKSNRLLDLVFDDSRDRHNNLGRHCSPESLAPGPGWRLFNTPAQKGSPPVVWRQRSPRENLQLSPYNFLRHAGTRSPPSFRRP